MNIKKIIVDLQYYNKWRKGWEWNQPNPKKITKAIDWAIEELKQIEMYNDICSNWIQELQFANLQKEHYRFMLDEVKTLLEQWVKPNLIKKVIENWELRAVLDISIHYDNKT